MTTQDEEEERFLRSALHGNASLKRESKYKNMNNALESNDII
jgi:hypothetical protein